MASILPVVFYMQSIYCHTIRYYSWTHCIESHLERTAEVNERVRDEETLDITSQIIKKPQRNPFFHSLSISIEFNMQSHV